MSYIKLVCLNATVFSSQTGTEIGKVSKKFQIEGTYDCS